MGQTITAGQWSGAAFEHTEASRRECLARAQVAIPASLNGGQVFFGVWRDLPPLAGAPVPVVIFMHGSSGLGLPAIGEWQAWLAGQGIASVAPDSFALPDRLTYTSPVDKDLYERIHALRSSEILLAREALLTVPWPDRARLVLAGTSEGAVAVARHDGAGFAARLVFSWSCEDNYFVDGHRTILSPDQPFLNIISNVDPCFSRMNPWLGNPAPLGHLHLSAQHGSEGRVLLIADAPHTLLNLPAARRAVVDFLSNCSILRDRPT